MKTKSRLPEQLGSAVPVASAEEALAIVQAWVEQFGYSYSPVEPEDSDDYAWVIMVTTSKGDHFAVAWRSAWNALQMQCSLGIEEPQQTAFRMMSLVDRGAFMADVMRFLLAKGVEYQVEPSEEHIGPEADAGMLPAIRVPKSVSVQKTLIADGQMSRKDFFEIHREVIGTAQAVVQMFTKMGMKRQWV